MNGITALLLVLCAQDPQAADTVEDEGAPAAAPAVPARVLRLKSKTVEPKKLLDSMITFYEPTIGVAVRKLPPEYDAITDDLVHAVDTGLQAYVKTKVLKPLPEVAEAEDIRAVLERHPSLKYLAVATVDPPEKGEVPVVLLELFTRDGEVKKQAKFPAACYWRVTGAPMTADEAKEAFDRDAWTLAYNAQMGWRFNGTGGMSPMWSSYPIVANADNGWLSDESIEEGARSPDVTSQMVLAHRAELFHSIFQWTGCGTMVVAPLAVACVGGCVGSLLAIPDVTQSGSPIWIGFGAIVGAVVGLIAAGVVTAIWGLPFFGLLEVVRLVAYYARKSFYFKAINAHNEVVARTAKVNLESQPSKYRPSSLLAD
jgi:hypothetical protein